MQQFIPYVEPTCKKHPKEITVCEHTRIDDYYWMNERDSPEVLKYIEEENNFTATYFNQFENLQNNILEEFNQRINPNDTSAPFIYNHKQYQIRNKEGFDYALIYQIETANEILFLDENERAKGKNYYSLAEWAISPNNELLAISEDFVGRRNYTITIRKNSDNTFFDDKITNTDGSIVWANDNETVFYIKKDPNTLREFQVYRHRLGTNAQLDELVFEETDEKFNVYLSKTLTNKYIEIQTASSSTSETLLIDADTPETKPFVFLNRKKDHLYSIFHHQEGFYILTNNHAKNNQLVFSKEIPQNIENLTVIIKHNETILLENILILKHFIITEERQNGLQKIRVINLLNNQTEYISLNEETYHLTLGTNDDYNAENIYYSYNSLTTPASIINYDLTSKNRTLFFQKELLDNTFNSENYESKRIWITTNDGSKVAVSMVYKKGLKLANAPLMLYGYGSYGITYPDVFSAYRLTLLNRGFVFAIAHIRGEKYLGEEWYENGKFLKKKNTFTDFINAAEFLGMKGYCDKNRIYAQGGSAGGLLMGAITNMAPYLWKGIIAQVPFVDVVTTMLDDSIPLTVGEYEEWGNPNEEEYYWYMLNYSPYDNVKPMNYPAMYITTGYHDSQVQYWEPLKWVAKMRELRTNKLPLLFDCNMDAGHGGGSGRTSERIEIAKNYSFILHLEGISK
ncbi:MAG: S9 family peptidase [Flavobacteriia bacterium]|nr:S9 family peptidase [Flavobacteriia bacterium]